MVIQPSFFMFRDPKIFNRQLIRIPKQLAGNQSNLLLPRISVPLQIIVQAGDGDFLLDAKIYELGGGQGLV